MQLLADGRQTVRVEIVASKAPLSLSAYGLLTKIYSNIFYGADYDATGFRSFQRSKWICPVTLFVGKQIDIAETFGFEIPDGCGKKYKSKRVKAQKGPGRPRKQKEVYLDS